MNAHPHCNFRILFEDSRNFLCTAHRLLRTVAKDQRHPVAGEQLNELFVGRLRAPA